ncbi:MAG TPA: hypothetical protein VF220_01470 [Nitrososphaeraceae archaeon]
MNKTIQNQIVKVEFGNKGYKTVREEMKKVDADFRTEFKDYLSSYLIDEFLTVVKEAGYRNIGRARLIFEEAIDYQSKFETTRIIERMNANKGKIPKFAFFSIDASSKGVPKVE